MKWGFKTKARELALEVRAELDLDVNDPLDPYALADLYGIQIFDLRNLDCSASACSHFTKIRPEVFSAALIPTDAGLVIVENSSHALVRRHSTIGHEMSHVLLEHQFTTRLFDEAGRACRSSDKDQEAEATELAGELLVPFKAARQLARRSATDVEVSLLFGVSTDFARWRMNSTGARKIASREAAMYRRS